MFNLSSRFSLLEKNNNIEMEVTREQKNVNPKEQKNVNPNIAIFRVPNAVLVNKIISLLPFKDIVSFGGTCTRFNQLVKRDSIWQACYHTICFKNNPLLEGLDFSKQDVFFKRKDFLKHIKTVFIIINTERSLGLAILKEASLKATRAKHEKEEAAKAYDREFKNFSEAESAYLQQPIVHGNGLVVPKEVTKRQEAFKQKIQAHEKAHANFIQKENAYKRAKSIHTELYKRYKWTAVPPSIYQTLKLSPNELITPNSTISAEQPVELQQPTNGLCIIF
jgi:F-box domain